MGEMKKMTCYYTMSDYQYIKLVFNCFYCKNCSAVLNVASNFYCQRTYCVFIPSWTKHLCTSQSQKGSLYSSGDMQIEHDIEITGEHQLILTKLCNKDTALNPNWLIFPAFCLQIMVVSFTKLTGHFIFRLINLMSRSRNFCLL